MANYEKFADPNELNKLNRTLNDSFALEQKAQNKLLELQIDNAKKLVAFRTELINEEVNKQAAAEFNAKKRLFAMEQDYIKKAQAKAAKAKGGALSKDEIKQIQDAAAQKYKIESEVYKKLAKQELAKAKREQTLQAQADYIAAGSALGSSLFGKTTLTAKMKGLSDAFTDKNGNTNIGKGFAALTSAIATLAQQLNSTITDIANSQSAVDTRLQGWRGATKKTITGGNSYWAAMSSNITKNIGASGLVKQSDVVSNLKTMVGMGIAFNVEQRAFLQTISAKIADTFDANDSALRQLIRIQQRDTTAARLGMESALTSFLNNMYETTEYMSAQASAIRQSLYEASALMGAANATAFEYQVQKWMGSLYSVGFSNTSGLASALGDLAAGKISSISGGGFGNLLVMAANRANMSIADILSQGLDDSGTNRLLQAMVSYLGGIYAETKGSNILAQQYAGVFGLTASDLKAAANLAGSLGNISKNNLSYGGMMSQLSNMANSMYQRTSLGELSSNAWSNFMYSTASGIANNPVLYALMQMSNLLTDTVGGIDFSLPMYMGTGTAQTFNVADIMKVAALSGSVLSGMGSMLGGLFSSGSGLLNKFGVGKNAVVSRGTGNGLLITSSSTGVSESGYAANSASGDITSKAMTETTDEQNEKVSAAKGDEVELKDVNDNLVEIFTLLKRVADGSASFKVDMGNASAWSDAIRSGIPF